MWDLNRFGDNQALLMETGMLTYRELAEASEKVAAGIGKRCLVFVLCTNTIAAIAGYIGCLNHKIVPVMIDNNLDKELLKHLIEVYRPEYLWVPESKSGDFLEYDEQLCLSEYLLLATGETKPFNICDDLALLMTTSGSTGSPKLVRQSYVNITENIVSIVEYLRIDEQERAITNLPINYVYGLSIVNTHLYVGASIVVTEKTLFQRDFWNLFKAKMVTNFGGVPYTYEMLNRLHFFHMELPTLKTLTQAGGKLSPTLHKKFADYAIKEHKNFVVMYGAAEATARMGYLPMEDSLAKCGSMGIAIPGGTFELQDDAGKIINGSNLIGELVYFGKNVTLGYAISGIDLAKSDENKGCLHTGDLAKRDDDGYYTIVGRKKRFLKIFGKRINLDETEQILRYHFPLIDIACAGVDDKMYIFTTATDNTEKIAPYLSAKLGIHSSAFKIKIISHIPKNPAGKTLYRELELYYD
jgi:acyl-CoA synthetase (AMP-forming)/AMP-acid ligase II